MTDYEQYRSFASVGQLEKLDALRKHGTVRAAAAAMQISERNFYRSLKNLRGTAAERGYSPENDQIHTIPENQSLGGVSTLYNEDGQVKMQWVKSKGKNEDLTREHIQELVEGLVGKQAKPKKAPTLKEIASEHLNAYIFGDPHLDMLSWDEETGANWDSEIAYSRHSHAMQDLIQRGPDAETGLLVILGDSLHRDSLKAMTPGSGNLVDVDGRLGKSFRMAGMLFRSMAEAMLKKHKHVDVVIIRGNHSETLELALSVALEFYFEKEDRINVVNNTDKHVPYMFGQNFLLMTHRDRLNDQKCADIATARFRDYHGACSFTHILTGHVHHAAQKEISGCLVETFQALPTPDAWHNESGYVTSDQSASLLTYHKSGGIVERRQAYPRIYMEAV